MVALIKRHKRQESKILKAVPWFFAPSINSNINTLNQDKKSMLINAVNGGIN